MHTKKYIIGVFAAATIAAPVTGHAGLQVAYDGNAKLGSYCYSEEEAAGKDLAYRVFRVDAPGTWDWDALPGEDECQPTLAQQKDSHCWFDIMGVELYHCEYATANNTNGCQAWGSGWDFNDDRSGTSIFYACPAKQTPIRSNAVCKSFELDEEIIGNFACKLKYNYTNAIYGCAAGYYASSGSGYEDIICTACPNSGQSSKGNTSISGCYIPSGGSCSDETGDCIVQNGNCYYQQ